MTELNAKSVPMDASGWVNSIDFGSRIEDVCAGAFSFIQSRAPDVESCLSLLVRPVSAIDKEIVTLDPSSPFIFDAGHSSSSSGREQLLQQVTEFQKQLLEKIEGFLRGATRPIVGNGSPAGDHNAGGLAAEKLHRRTDLNVVIRLADSSGNDWKQIKSVHNAAYTACHAPRLGVPVEQAWFEPSGTCFVAEVLGGQETGDVDPHGRLCGFVYCNAVPGDASDDDWSHGEPFIDDLFVDPQHHRKGIGSLLLSTAIDHLSQQQGCETVVLAVLEATPDAHSFYETNGFRHVPERAFLGPVCGHQYRVYQRKLDPKVQSVRPCGGLLGPKNTAKTKSGSSSSSSSSSPQSPSSSSTERPEDTYSVQHLAGLHIVLELLVLLGVHPLLPPTTVIPPDPTVSAKLQEASEGGYNQSKESDALLDRGSPQLREGQQMDDFRPPLVVLSVFPSGVKRFVEVMLPRMYALSRMTRSSDLGLKPRSPAEVAEFIGREVGMLSELARRLGLLCGAVTQSDMANFFLPRFLPDLLSGLVFLKRRRGMITHLMRKHQSDRGTTRWGDQLNRSLVYLDETTKTVSAATSRLAQGTDRIEACLRLLHRYSSDAAKQHHADKCNSASGKKKVRETWFPEYIGAVLSNGLLSPGGVAACVEHMLGHVSRADFSEAFMKVAALLIKPSKRLPSANAYFEALGEQLVDIFHSHNPLLARNESTSASSSNDEEVSMLDKLHYVSVLTADELARHHPLQCRKLLSKVFPRLSEWTRDQVGSSPEEAPQAAQRQPKRHASRGSRTVRRDMADFLAIVEATKCRPEFAQLLLEHVAPGVFAAQLHVSVGRPKNVLAGDRHQRDLCERCTAACIWLQTRAPPLINVRGEEPLAGHHQLLPLWRILAPHYRSFALSCNFVRPPPENFIVEDYTPAAAVHFISSSDVEFDASIVSAPDRFSSETLRQTTFALADALICTVQRIDASMGSISSPSATTTNLPESPRQLAPQLFVELLGEQLAVGTHDDSNHNWSLLIGASIARFEAVIGPGPVLADTVRSTCAVARLLCHTLSSLMQFKSNGKLSSFDSQIAEQSASAIVSLMTLLIALLEREKKLIQAKAEACSAQQRFDSVLLKLTPAEGRDDGDAHSDARRARHDRWVSDADAQAEAVRKAVRPLIPMLAAIQTVSTKPLPSPHGANSLVDSEAASRFSSAVTEVAKELHIKIVTLDSAAAGPVGNEQPPSHVSDPNDDRDLQAVPNFETKSLESGFQGRGHLPRPLLQQALCSKLRLLCAIPAVIDGARLADLACNGIFAAEPFERAFALDEIKLWAKAACESTRTSSENDNAKAIPKASPLLVSHGNTPEDPEDNVLSVLTRLLLAVCLSDAESFVFLRVMDVLSTLAQKGKLETVLKLALLQFADKKCDTATRAKTAQVLEHLIGVAGALLPLHATYIVDTLLDTFRDEYATQSGKKLRHGNRATPIHTSAAHAAVAHATEIASAAAASKRRNELRRKRLLERQSKKKSLNDGSSKQLQDDHQALLDDQVSDSTTLLAQSSKLLEEINVVADISNTQYAVQIGCVTLLGKICLVLPPESVPRRPRIYLLFRTALAASATAVPIRRAIANAVARFLSHHLSPYRGHIGAAAAADHFYPHSLLTAMKTAASNDSDAVTRHYAQAALNAADQQP